MKPKKKLVKETGLGWAFLRDGHFVSFAGPLIITHKKRAIELCSKDETVVRVRHTVEQVR